VAVDGEEFAFNRELAEFDPESAYLLERYYKDFVRAGAKLSDSEKEKLKKINAELAGLQTNFEQNLLKERNASSVVVDKKEELAGVTDDQMKSVINAAKAENKEGKFVIQLQNTTGQPLLGSLQNRPLRERLMQASLARNSTRRLSESSGERILTISTSRTLSIRRNMPRIPGLLRAQAEQARGRQIRVKRMNIGKGVMQEVVLLTPEDVTTPDAI